MKLPFTKPLTVLLVEDTPAVQAQADADIRSIEEGAITVRQPLSEAYFHRLRLRVSENPRIAENIVVFYQDAEGKLHEIGLRFEDENRWPVGFYTHLWKEEVDIQKVRHDRRVADSAAPLVQNEPERNFRRVETIGERAHVPAEHVLTAAPRVTPPYTPRCAFTWRDVENCDNACALAMNHEGPHWSKGDGWSDGAIRKAPRVSSQEE